MRITAKSTVDIMPTNEFCSSRAATVLVVDDDVSITTSYSRILKGRCHMLSANDAATAAKLLAETGSVDLLVLDITMPDYDGIELLRDLAAKGIYLRVALISGWNEDILSGAGTLASGLGHQLIGAYTKPTRVAKILDEAGISLDP